MYVSRLCRLVCFFCVLLPAASNGQTQSPFRAQGFFPPHSPDVNFCQLDEVLPHVTAHVRELVENVNRFTATETLEHERLSHEGKLKDQARSESHYIADIHEVGPNDYAVEEYRNHTRGLSASGGMIRANLAPALALVFHPSHIDEFEMSCTGPVDWHGHSTWQIHFEQRMDRPARMSAFQVGNRNFTLLLKGDAWVGLEDYQILHLESDLLRPIAVVQLNELHQAVDYGPVQFAARHITLWLPWEANVAANLHGKHLVERHKYRDFELFSIDTGQKVKDPAEPSN